MSFNATQPLITTSDEDTDMYDSPNLTGSPERRLLLAVLERAILDYVGNDKREIELAKEWIFARADESQRAVFSFEWVCQQLDLNPEDIAETVRQMPKRGNSKIAPWYLVRQDEREASKKQKKFKDHKVRQVNFTASGHTSRVAGQN